MAREYIVTICELRSFDIPVYASDEEQARDIAMECLKDGDYRPENKSIDDIEIVEIRLAKNRAVW